MALGGAPGSGTASPAASPASAPKTVADFAAEFNVLKTKLDNQVKTSLSTYGASINSVDHLIKDGAKDVLSTEMRAYRDEYVSFRIKLPRKVVPEPGAPKDEKDAEKNALADLKKEVDGTISALEKGFPFTIADQIKQIDENSQEAVAIKNRDKLKTLNKSIGTVYGSLLRVLGNIETKKKLNIKISDVERLAFEEESEALRTEYLVLSAELKYIDGVQGNRALNKTDTIQKQHLDRIAMAVNAIDGVAATATAPATVSILDKITAALDKPVDETKEKFPKIATSLTEVQGRLSQIGNDIDKVIKEDGKVTDDERPPFILRLALETNSMEQIHIDIDDAVSYFTAPGVVPTPKQMAQVAALRARESEMLRVITELTEKINESISSKEQRKNAKEISDSLVATDKQMKTEYDALEIGKGYDDGQKATFKIAIDEQEIKARDARDELALLPNIPKNQPTRTMIEGILTEIDTRIVKMKEKIEKKRVAKEKEVLEKLDAAEKEIEKVEQHVREQSRKDAEGKGKFDENQTHGDKPIDKLRTPFMKYKNGVTHEDHSSLVDTLFDPKEDISKVKSWIKDMPDSTSIEIKLKKKLMKKARRLSRRTFAAKWRHYWSLDKKNQAKYWGVMAKTAAFDKVSSIFD